MKTAITKIINSITDYNLFFIKKYYFNSPPPKQKEEILKKFLKINENIPYILHREYTWLYFIFNCECDVEDILKSFSPEPLR